MGDDTDKYIDGEQIGGLWMGFWISLTHYQGDIDSYYKRENTLSEYPLRATYWFGR